VAPRQILSAPPLEDMIPELGMRRVRWVRISVSDDGVRADVAGLAHRFPIIRPVPMHWANTLIKAGCPYVVRRVGRIGRVEALVAAEVSASAED
jgi:hypothetical protein